MRAIDAIRRPPVTIECDQTITDAARLMDQQTVGALVVTDHDRLAGIVTDRDVVVRGVARRVEPDARIDGVMTTEPATVPADADLRDALPLLARDSRSWPEVQGRRPITRG